MQHALSVGEKKKRAGWPTAENAEIPAGIRNDFFVGAVEYLRALGVLCG
jgi:hypothetical protein